MGVFVNNVSVPGQPYKVDSDCYISACRSLFDIADKTQIDSGNDIDKYDWIDGYSLFGFSLQPHYNSGETLSLINQANVRLEISFAEVLPETVSCILYAEFPTFFEIDSTRNLILNP